MLMLVKIMFKYPEGASVWPACRLLPSSQGTRGQDSCGELPFCPFFQASILQGPSEWSGLTMPNHTCYFSKESFPCCFLSRCFGEKQTPPPPNLTEHRKKSACWVHLTGNERGIKCYGERTYSSCCPWSLSRRQGCKGRTQMCFFVSSYTHSPPDLYSVCGSLCHSLEGQTK